MHLAVAVRRGLAVAMTVGSPEPLRSMLRRRVGNDPELRTPPIYIAGTAPTSVPARERLAISVRWSRADLRRRHRIVAEDFGNAPARCRPPPRMT